MVVESQDSVIWEVCFGTGCDFQRDREGEYCAAFRLRQAVSYQLCRDHACRLA